LPYILQREYRTLYGRFLPDSKLIAAGVLQRQPIEDLLKAHQARRADHGNRLWLLLNAELWYRVMVLGHSREDLRGELAEAATTTGAAAA
jgi:hypothetical protein